MTTRARGRSVTRRRTRISGRRPVKSRHLSYLRHGKSHRGYIQYPRQCDGRRPQETLPGEYESAESRAAYEKSLAHFIVHGTPPPGVNWKPQNEQPAEIETATGCCTVDQLWAHFERDRLPDYSYPEICLFRSAMKRLRVRYGDRPVDTIGKRELREARQLFLAAGNCRKTINSQVYRIRVIFTWGQEEELVPDEIPAKLLALRPLKPGQAPENDPVVAVPMDVVEATKEHLPQEAIDLIDVLYRSGARGGELYRLRVGDINQKSDDVWTYDMRQHKTTRFGHDRSVKFGPHCIEILERLVEGRKDADTVFERRPGKAWTRSMFCHLIARVCKRHGIPHWHPHQLRHAAGTHVFNQPGGSVAAAQAFLGHHRASTTEIYIRPEHDLAEELARKFG